jgi:predicted nucleic acid-binding Zn ribbon protein
MIDKLHNANLYVGYISNAGIANKNQDPTMTPGQPNTCEDFDALVFAADFRRLAAGREEIHSATKNQDPAMSTGQPNQGEDFEALISAAGRALAALRVVRTKHCAACGREFAGISKAKFCSEACRAKAWRKGKKQAKAEA